MCLVAGFGEAAEVKMPSEAELPVEVCDRESKVSVCDDRSYGKFAASWCLIIGYKIAEASGSSISQEETPSNLKVSSSGFLSFGSPFTLEISPSMTPNLTTSRWNPRGSP